MSKLIHAFLCNVSRRYRVTHCHHVDELPRRIQRKLLKSCQEMDPRSWDSAEAMMRDLEREIEEEERMEAEQPAMNFFRRTAAVFA